jgi:uncharacterized protein YkwD
LAVLPKVTFHPVKTLVVLGATAVVCPASAVASCSPAADRNPGNTAASLQAARGATLCLLNAERHGHGLHELRLNRKLSAAGLRHARDMVDKRYFSHDDPSGEDFVQRILDTDYVPASASYSLGENLAWGSRGLSSPRATVENWMHSPDHRRNILQRAFREIGIAIVIGAPVSGAGQGATYATEYGAVRRG